VLLYDTDPAKEMESALAGYRPVKTIAEPRARAILYEPGDTPKSGALSQSFEN